MCFKQIMYKHDNIIYVAFKDIDCVDSSYDVIFEETFNEENYIKACDFCIEDIKA